MKNVAALTLLFISIIIGTTLEAQTWSSVPLPSKAAFVNNISEAPNGDLYAITQQGLFKSTDDGDNWVERSHLVSGMEILTITPSGYILFEDGQNIMRLTPADEIEYVMNF